MIMNKNDYFFLKKKKKKIEMKSIHLMHLRG